MKPITGVAKQQGISLHQKGLGTLLPSFVCGIFGTPGSGKSTIVQNFLLNQEMYGKKFERVIFIGPTFYPQLIQDMHNHHKTIDIEWIMSAIREANKWGCKSMLIIFDDVVSSLKSAGQGQNRLVDLFFNRRHLLLNGAISIIITAQKWNMVPTFIRIMLNMVVVFRLGKQQLEIMAKQVAIPLPRRDFVAIVSSLKRHDFLYLNVQDQTMFNSNWDQVG